MKKIILTLVASFALVQSAHAITSALNQSLNIIDTITGSTLIQEVIVQNEFVVDIKRKTKDVSASTAIYEIRTVSVQVSPAGIIAESNAGVEEGKSCHKKGHHHHKNSNTHLYIATVVVTPNPGIGPPVVTIISIVPATK